MTNKELINKIPKAELHIHIEGSLEPELMFKLAKRNKINIPYKSEEEIRAAYNFSCLQDFLDIYYAGANVLQTKEDFYDLTYAYLKRVHKDNVKHVEIFFDPQTHTDRGIAFETVISGINDALVEGEKELDISSFLIMCFLRHLTEDEALQTLKDASPFKEKILGIGLDSSEKGNPPHKFKRVFAKARNEGYITVAHAGEEGPVEYIQEAIDILHVERIDHGNTIVNDNTLMERVSQEKLSLTMCPLSNLKLKVIENLDKYPIKELTEKGINVTINSDDPAYFGAYINQNYHALNDAGQISSADIIQLAKNSFKASFLSENDKSMHYGTIDAITNKKRS